MPRADGIQRDALNHATRELLLAQSSDWPFIITGRNNGPRCYPKGGRTPSKFPHLEDQVRHNRVNVDRLKFHETKHNLLPHLDYRFFQSLADTIPGEKEKLFMIGRQQINKQP